MQLLSTPITEESLTRTLDTWELRYQYNQTERGYQYSDTQMVKMLKKYGFIENHRAYEEEYVVLLDKDATSLKDFVVYYLDIKELIEKIEA